MGNSACGGRRKPDKLMMNLIFELPENTQPICTYYDQISPEDNDMILKVYQENPNATEAEIISYLENFYTD